MEKSQLADVVHHEPSRLTQWPSVASCLLHFNEFCVQSLLGKLYYFVLASAFLGWPLGWVVNKGLYSRTRGSAVEVTTGYLIYICKQASTLIAEQLNVVKTMFSETVDYLVSALSDVFIIASYYLTQGFYVVFSEFIVSHEAVQFVGMFLVVVFKDVFTKAFKKRNDIPTLIVSYLL